MANGNKKGIGIKIELNQESVDKVQQQIVDVLKKFQELANDNPITVMFDDQRINNILSAMGEVANIAKTLNADNMVNDLQDAVKFSDKLSEKLGEIVKQQRKVVNGNVKVDSQTYKPNNYTTVKSSTYYGEDSVTTVTDTTINKTQILNRLYSQLATKIRQIGQENIKLAKAENEDVQEAIRSRIKVYEERKKYIEDEIKNLGIINKERQNELEDLQKITDLKVREAQLKSQESKKQDVVQDDGTYQLAKDSLREMYRLKTLLITATEQESRIIKEQLASEENKYKNLKEQLTAEQKIALERTESNRKNILQHREELQTIRNKEKIQKDLLAQTLASLQKEYQLRKLVSTGNDKVKTEAQKQLDVQEEITKNLAEQLDKNNQLIVSEHKKQLEAKLNLDIAKATGKEANNSIMNQIAKWDILRNTIRKAFQEIKDGFNFVNELNKELTQIAIVTGQGQDDVAKLAKQYNDLALALKVTTQEVAQASVEFYRQGLGHAEVMERMQTTTKYAKISNLDFAQSAEILTATVNSMGVSIEKASDIFAYIGDATASGADEVGQAIQRVGGTASALEVPLEKLASWVGVLSAKTRENAEVIGNSLKSLMARYQQLRESGFAEEDGTRVNQVAKALNEVGIQIIDMEGNFRDFTTVLDELGAKWDSLTNRQKAYISTTFAGTHQQARFLNLMQSYADSIELYEGALDSAGVTQTKYNIWLESTEAHMNTLRATAEQLWMNIFDDETIRDGIDALTRLVEKINSIVESFGGLKTMFTAGIASLMLFRKEFRAFNLEMQTIDGKTVAVNTGWFKLGDTIKKVITQFKQMNKEIQISKALGMSNGQIIANYSGSILKLGASLASTTIKQIGLNTVMAIGNALMSAGISIIVSGIVSALTSWGRKAKEVKQANEELLNTVRQNIMANNNDIQALSQLADEYEALRNKQNLSTNEKERFYEISSRIAELVPELVLGYDEEGRAIIDTTKSMKEYIEVLKQKNALEQMKLVSNGQSAFDQMKNDISDAIDEMNKLQKEFDNYKKTLEVTVHLPEQYGLPNVSIIGYDRIKEAYATGKYKNFELDEMAIARLGEALDEYAVKQKEFQANQELQKSILKTSRDMFFQYTKAILESQEAFQFLDRESKDTITKLAQGFDPYEFGGFAEYSKALRDLVDTLGNDEFSNHIADIEKLNTAYKEGAIEQQKYNEELTKIITQISEMGNLPADAVSILESMFKISKDNIDLLANWKTAEELAKEWGEGIEDLNKELSNTYNELSKLNSVIDSLNRGQDLTIDQVIELVRDYGLQASAIKQTADGYTIEKQALEEIRQIKIKERQDAIQAEIDKARQTLLSTGDRISMYSAEIQAIQTLADAQRIAMNFKDIPITDNMPTAVKELFEGYNKSYTESRKKLEEYGKLVEKLNFLKESLNNPSIGTSSRISSKKSSTTEKQITSIIDKETEFITIIDVQNGLLDKQSEKIDEINEKISELSNKQNYTETIKQQNNLYNEQKKLLDLLNSTRSKYVATEKDIIKAFNNKGWFKGVDLNKLTETDFNATYDRLFAGTRNFGTGDQAEAKKKAFEEDAKLFKNLVSQWLKMKEAIDDTDKSIKSVAKSMSETLLQRSKTELEALTNSYEKSIKSLDNKMKDLDLAQAKLADNDIQGQMEIETRRRELYNNKISETLTYLNKLTKTKATSAEHQQELDKAYAEGIATLREYQIALAEVDKTMINLEEKSLQLVEDTQNKIIEIINASAEKKRKILDKEYNDKKNALQRERELYQRQNEAEDFDRELAREQEKLNAINAEIANASRDSSLAGQLRLRNLQEQAKEQQAVIDELTRRRARELNEDLFEDKERQLEEQYRSELASLDQFYSEERVKAMAQSAILTGYFQDVSGAIIDVKNEFSKFEDEFGTGITAIANKIKNEFNEALKQSKSILSSMGTIKLATTGLPSYDVGSKYLLKDQIAQVHKGEAIIPASMNPFVGGNALMNFMKTLIPSLNLPSISTPNLASTGVNIHFDKPLISVEGDVSEGMIPTLNKLAENVKDMVADEIVNQFFNKGLNIH